MLRLYPDERRFRENMGYIRELATGYRHRYIAERLMFSVSIDGKTRDAGHVRVMPGGGWVEVDGWRVELARVDWVEVRVSSDREREFRRVEGGAG